jgi:hypothetical protein
VDPGTQFKVTHSGDRITLDFHDHEDRWVTWNNDRVGDEPFAESGTVPEDAAYAIVCIQRAAADFPFLRAWVPILADTWTYWDGF